MMKEQLLPKKQLPDFVKNILFTISLLFVIKSGTILYIKVNKMYKTLTGMVFGRTMDTK